MKMSRHQAIFANRLVFMRERRRMTQKELSQKAQVPPACISQYESGQRAPNFHAVISLSVALKVSVDYLVGRSHNMRGKPRR